MPNPNYKGKPKGDKPKSDRVLTLSTVPKPGVTTVSQGRNFIADIYQTEDGRFYFYFNSMFADADPKDIIRTVKAAKAGKVYCNVYINKGFTAEVPSSDGPSPSKGKKAKAETALDAEDYDLDVDGEDDDDFDA